MYMYKTCTVGACTSGNFYHIRNGRFSHAVTPSQDAAKQGDSVAEKGKSEADNTDSKLPTRKIVLSTPREPLFFIAGCNGTSL